MTARSPRVTIVTSTYNWPAALRLAIATVLEQTYEDFEYLVVGDHCTDSTEQAVSSYADPRIRWINLEGHQGNQSNVNKVALAQARGELIAYLNHDDLWLPNHLEDLVALFDTSPDLNIANSLCLSISPPPHLHREILGLPYKDRRASGALQRRFPGVSYLARKIRRKFKLQFNLSQHSSNLGAASFSNSAMASSVMHRASAGIAAGGWQNWRETHEIPTQDFFRRLRALDEGFAVLGKVTAIKFHSGDRKQCYSIGRADEQEHTLVQLRSDPHWLANELAVASLCGSLDLHPPKLPQPNRPRNAPFGWQIEQWRRMRGMRPLIDLTSSEPDETLLQLPPPSTLLRLTESATSFWNPATGVARK